MEDLIAQFPDKIKFETSYRSFIYQPERVSINSRQALQQPSLSGAQFQPDYYYQFETELKSPILRIKKIELLRATIPNAVTSIPLSQGAFFYYRIPALNAPEEYAPDYSLLETGYIHMVRLLPQTAYNPDDYNSPLVDYNYAFNRTFQDYEDLVNELNKATKDDPNFNPPYWLPHEAYPPKSYTKDPEDGLERLWYSADGSEGTADFNTDNAWVALPVKPFIPNDIEFSFNETLNKIVVEGKNYFDEALSIPQYYYLPVGYGDPNLVDFIASINQTLTTEQFPSNLPYTLNRRLGFLWSGILQAGAIDDEIVQNLEQHTFPKPNWVGGNGGDYSPILPYYTTEGYADLVNTGNVFVYCDFVGGSTQDTTSDERLLAVFPMNASNLAVGFGESKITCPLTKVSENLYKIIIMLRTDTGEPFWLPTNAYVNLELKIEYD